MSAELTAQRAALSATKRALLQARLQAGKNKSAPAPTIARRTNAGPAPLSFAQKRLWFLDQLAPANPFYNIPAALPLKFQVSVDVLTRVLNEIVSRHESLRTQFVVEDDEPVQVVVPKVDLPLHFTDLQDAGSDSDEQLLALASEETCKPFDLSTAPLIRARLVKCGAADYTLLLTLHHIVADGWSMGVLFRELAALYEAFALGKPSPLRPLSIQYPDFAEWQCEYLQGAVMAQHVDYWRRALDRLPVMALPTDRRRPQVATFSGSFHSLHLPRKLSEQINSLAHRQGVTPFMVLLAIFKILLHRYTSQDDIVVGAPIANRNRAEIEPLIGFFVNTLVLRTDLSGDPGFSEVLKRVREITLNAYAHQDLPFEKLVEILKPERDLSRNPLCQITFQLQNAPGASSEIPDIDEPPLIIKRNTSIFDIAFSLWHTTDGYIGGIEYSTDLFDAETIERLGRHFERLCAEVIAHNDLPIARLSFIDDAERNELLYRWNKTETRKPGQQLLHNFFEVQADQRPEADALRLGANSLSFGELEKRANRIAHLLTSRGVAVEAVVGVCMQRSFDLVASLLGIQKAGAAYMPIDPDLPPGRITFMTNTSAASVVLTQEQYVAKLTDLGLNPIVVDTEVLNEFPESRPLCKATPESLAYVLYTSGSTGRPKGVMVTHAAICNHMEWMISRGLVLKSDHVLQRTPITFDASVWELFAPLHAGALMVLLPPGNRADLALLIDTIATHRVTVLQLVPSMLSMLLDEADLQSCRSLQRVFCGGEELSGKLVDRFHAVLPAELHNLYGPTETAIDATSWKCDFDPKRSCIPIGRPIDNTQIYLLDQHLNPVPIGVPGDIWIAGSGVSRGYAGRPDLTAQQFWPDPFNGTAGARMYRTGDLGRYDREGLIEYLGRGDNQVKLRGYRIELGELEAKLVEHPAVDQAVAIVREDQPGDTRLVAYVRQNDAYVSQNEEHVVDIRGHRLKEWQSVFEDVYSTARASNDELDTVGWNDSYTELSIPADEMREWQQQTIARIRKLRRDSVLEIGCGTGMLLFDLAPDCTRYVALDFSERVVETVREKLRSRANLPHVEVEQRAAHALSDYPEHSFDLVILNSIVQYFPDANYLLRVLEGAFRLVRQGGFIFLGDLFSLPLLKSFCLSVELAHASRSTSIAELRRRVNQRVSHVKELYLDPSFFRSLSGPYPIVKSVWLQPKRGVLLNEMSRFRYDAMLQIGGEPAGIGDELILDWQRQGLTFDGVRDLLRDPRHEVFSITGIPNSRVLRYSRAVEFLADGDGLTDVESLERALALEPAGIDPEGLCSLESGSPYELELCWNRVSADGAIDLTCRRRNGSVPMYAAKPASLTPGLNKPDELLKFANNPLQMTLTSWLAPELLEYLKSSLPDYMLPGAIVVLDSFPLKSNGKVDRSSLPCPDHSRVGAAEDYVAPRNDLERFLAHLTGQVLRIEDVGVHDNFFTQLGGHSLLATQLASRIREVLQTEFPLRLIFEHPTVAGIAASMSDDPQRRNRLERIAQLWLEVEQLQPHEVEALSASTRAPGGTS